MVSGTRSHRLLVPLLLVACCPSVHVQGDEAWQTGVDFRKQLEASVGFRWGGNATLRDSLARLGRSQRIAIWLDRRIDPDQPMDLAIDAAALEHALRTVAATVGCRVCYVDSVVYIGPPSTTTKLATLAAIKRDAANKLPPSARQQFQRKKAWKWEEVTAPKDLLVDLAREAKVRVVEDERLPHDLWAAGDLPPLSVADRLSLLLAGFDLTFEISRDGTAIRPVAIPEAVSLERSYTPRISLATVESKIAADFPDVRIRRTGNRLTIVGSFEDHDMIARLLRGETVRRKMGPPAETNYSLTTTSPVGGILKEIARRAKLDVKVDPAVAPLLQERVTVEVQQATLRQLLDATLEPAGIRYDLEDKTLSLLPARP